MILTPGLTVIPDTLADPRMCDNPLCLETPNLRFYAGMCLETEDGLPLGTLCVLDQRPRDLSAQQRKFLQVLAQQVMVQMKLNLKLKESQALRDEIDHRVKNSLGLVSAVLGLQARQSREQNVKSALALASNRVRSIATVHEVLHQTGSTAQVRLDEFVAQLVGSLQAQSKDGILVVADVPSVLIRASDASNVGLVINELATNALKHGFNGRASGQITITGEQKDNRIRLTVKDDGTGLPEGFDPAQSKGFGMRLALTLAKGFGRELQWRALDGSTEFSFEFAAV